ncbi:uncharacterized protein LOC106658808 [Trichogramma pretiosum]|uniref:uncharacterized protein LOC106658808 n=1 Tax=Trichogramma pretiosum TaxID=7493 RepID=UPI0006C979F9|nr:uncharacterized protein LOC106658808 [Trichogramma pretiosum]XP_014236416.1 uncharacterized protein LOC106658808 [Trichogramma pretiosum]
MHDTSEDRFNPHQQQHHLRAQVANNSNKSNGAAAHQANGAHHHHHHQHHPPSKGSTRMACEKASRKLRATLLKAARIGVTTNELARLPSAKKIVSQRDHDWKLAVLLLLMFGGGVIVALVCTTSRGCSKIEDINLAT